MLYYFSGTGNSQWAAETLAAQLGDEAMSITAAPAGERIAARAGEAIGVVFPIYAWGAPRIMERFLERVNVEPGAYAYAVCTCGDEAGSAMKVLKKRFAYDAAWSVAMPNNYIIGYDVDKPELAREKVARAGERLAEIARAVRGRERIYSVHAGPAAWLKTAVACPAFNAFARGTKPFFAGDACNACSLCAENCPSGAIRMVDKKPVWVRKHCEQCMRCIMRCPKACIQYGAHTAHKGRYYFHEVQ